MPVATSIGKCTIMFLICSLLNLQLEYIFYFTLFCIFLRLLGSIYNFGEKIWPRKLWKENYLILKCQIVWCSPAFTDFIT